MAAKRVTITFSRDGLAALALAYREVTREAGQCRVGQNELETFDAFGEELQRELPASQGDAVDLFSTERWTVDLQVDVEIFAEFVATCVKLDLRTPTAQIDRFGDFSSISRCGHDINLISAVLLFQRGVV